MFLCKRPANKVYYLFFTDELGKRRSVSTRCKAKSDALKFFQAFKLKEHERKINLARISLSKFIPVYVEYSKGVHSSKSTTNIEYTLKAFHRAIGDLPLHKIGVREIEIFLATKRQKRSAWTARYYYIALASAFETAKRWGNILENPFRQIQKPKVPETQPVFFSQSDFLKLLQSIKGTAFRELVFMAVSTGMRLSELTSLEWQAIDFVRKTIFLSNTENFTTKNGKERVVPMTEALLQMLLERKERVASETQLIFHHQGTPLTKDFVSKTFKRHVVAAGLNRKLHFHSLRHTFASWLAQDGVSLYSIQKLLGHSSSTMTQVYSHLQPEQLHATVNRIEISFN